jgi:hypothetical protein
MTVITKGADILIVTERIVERGNAAHQRIAGVVCADAVVTADNRSIRAYAGLLVTTISRASVTVIAFAQTLLGPGQVIADAGFANPADTLIHRVALAGQRVARIHSAGIAIVTVKYHSVHTTGRGITGVRCARILVVTNQRQSGNTTRFHMAGFHAVADVTVIA